MNKWGFYTTNEIKPDGWLKRQLEIQAAGLSGHLDKMWKNVKDSAWIGGAAGGSCIQCTSGGNQRQYGYERSPGVVGAEEEISLYPYGCSKLRMTELPFID